MNTPNGDIIMPLTVTTLDDEEFDIGTLAGETNDGTGLSLREAVGLINSTSTGPITFDVSLAGGTMSLTLGGSLNMASSFTINGDATNDGVADITILSNSAAPFMTFDTAGVSFVGENLNLLVDASAGTDARTVAMIVNADNVSITNDGDFDIIGVDTGFGDRATAVQFTGDNFTFTNTAGSSIISTGRHVIDAPFVFDPNTGMTAPTGLNTTINNDGLMEATDDTIRLAEGTINNTGTIRTTGTFDFGGNFAFSAQDAIAVIGEYDPSYVPPAGGVLTVNNSATGLIDGYRSALQMTGGGTVTNEGTITGDASAFLVQSFFGPNGTFLDTNFTLDNSGTISNLGGDFGYNSSTDYSTIGAINIYLGTMGSSASITNSGTISSTELVISANSGAALVNTAAGQILSDTDNANGDAVAYRGAQLADFEVTVSTTFPGAAPNLNIVSSQGFTIDGNGDLVTSSGTFSFQNGQVETLILSGVDAPFILPLVDVTASQNSGFVVFVRDPNTGQVQYPATLDVQTVNNGVVRVNFDAAAYIFTVTDLNGAPVFAAPSTINFVDDIMNEGLIDGDIFTGLGDDIIINTGSIMGDIDMGEGNDTFTMGTGGTLSGTVNGGNGDDVLMGGAMSDDLYGDGGDDTLSGGQGSDNLFGGEGDDILEGGGGGADVINGGAGFDLASYEGSTNRVNISIINGTNTGSHAIGDSYVSIEGLIGSAFGDTLTGNAMTNELYGGGGKDIMNGFKGDDFLYGGDGNDFMTGGLGADFLDGGNGNDIARYNGSSSGVTIDLVAGTGMGGSAQGDTLINIEHLFGSNHADTLLGDAGNNRLFGHNGDDFISGGAGIDRFTGGAGSDTFDFNVGDKFAVIMDFTDDVDQIDLTDFAYATLADALNQMSEVNGDVRFSDGNGNGMLIQDTTIAELTDDILI